jgi:pimeloyl-ACP methyl ester carboxylesterase
MKPVVLVHGGFVDGSGWEPVYRGLRQAGHQVSVAQHPTRSLTDDAAVVGRVLDQQPEPGILVGHSYGGAVITQAGNHPNVAALVYICAFAPDSGESTSAVIEGFPAEGPQPPILPPVDGFLFLDKSKFAASFAADVSPDLAAFWADASAPVGRGSPERPNQRRGVETQTELVPHHQRRPHDPARPATGDGTAGGSDHRRDGGQPLRFRVSARGCDRNHQKR